MYSLVYDPCTRSWVTDIVDKGEKLVPELTKIPVSQVHCQSIDFTLEEHTHVAPRMWSDAVLHKTNNKKSMIHFGGLGIGKSHPKIEFLDLSTFKWSLPDLSAYHNKNLPYVNIPRWGHTACIVPDYDPNKVILFGGWDSNAQYCDLYEYDVISHTIAPLKTSGEPPSPRSCHSVSVLKNQMILFGGAVCENGPYKYYNDVHTLDMKTLKWHQLQSTYGRAPTPRSQHGAVVVWDRYILIIGGYDGTWGYSDIYCLDSVLNMWHKVELDGDVPAPMHFTSTNFSVDTCKLCCTAVDEDTIFISGFCGGNYFLNISNWRLQKIENQLPSLTSHTLVKLKKHKIVIFGGCDKTTKTSKTYLLDFQ